MSNFLSVVNEENDNTNELYDAWKGNVLFPGQHHSNNQYTEGHILNENN